VQDSRVSSANRLTELRHPLFSAKNRIIINSANILVCSTKPAAEGNDLDLAGETIESNWNTVTDK
jgi:hypothetical protein